MLVNRTDNMGEAHAAWAARALSTVSAEAPRGIDERSHLDPAEFVGEFWARNRPVVYRGLIAESWPVRHLSLEFLAAQYGAETVQIFDERRDDEHMGWNMPAHFRPMLLGDYVREMQEAPSNLRYICSHNRAFQTSRLGELLPNFPALAQICNGDNSDASLWLGGTGVITWLHFDVVNSLSLQVFGRKRFLLAPPSMRPLVYNRLSGYSEVDAEKPDLQRFPLFSGVHLSEVVLAPGDALFVPAGWWHHVRTLETACSVGYKNFRWANNFGYPACLMESSPRESEQFAEGSSSLACFRAR